MVSRYTASTRPRPDAAAVAAIKPGMPGDALRAAFGPGWREPAPHKGGVVDVAEKTMGAAARLDLDDKVGEIVFHWHFPKSAAILGLRIGMPLADAVSAMPDLDVGQPMQYTEYMRMGQARRDDFEIVCAFHSDKLNGVRLWNRGARYKEPGPPLYLPATAPVGAPFEDTNFKLVVLSNLLDSKTIDLGTPVEFFAHVLGRPYDKNNEPFGEIAEARAYLDGFQLTPELLSAVECPYFDGGNEIYNYIEDTHLHDWDALVVQDFYGIELLPNVTQFHAISGVHEVDLRVLTALPKLRELTIDVDYTHPEALLDLPSLAFCKIMGNEAYADVTQRDHPTREIMETLKARGVKVWVHWISHSGAGRPPAYE